MRVLDGEKRPPVELKAAASRLGAPSSSAIKRPNSPVTGPPAFTEPLLANAGSESKPISAAPDIPQSNSLLPPSNGPLPDFASRLETGSTLANSNDPVEPKPALPPRKPVEAEAEKAPPSVAPAATETDPPQTVSATPPPVNAAPIYVPPRPLRQVVPNSKPWIIPSALEIQVEVKLDASGHVEAARLLKHEHVPMDLAGVALAAAKQWIFKPATLRSVRVESNFIIVFTLRPPER